MTEDNVGKGGRRTKRGGGGGGVEGERRRDIERAALLCGSI